MGLNKRINGYQDSILIVDLGRSSRRNLSEAELKKLLKEEHTQGKPYEFCMPNGIHKAAVCPDKALGEHDLEWPAKEFIFLVGLARDPDLDGMLAYKPRHGPWHSVDPTYPGSGGFSAKARR
jgi:hypothetical protein